ncbi:zinc-dependent peptidase [Lysobacter arenosi]|uniref:Zinc-dependent peptidase n=1 Tax=Lysobacter arenosi TaxID=2795387 RepID=A0ABX7R6P0_9GAMM|nr:zinc-dependent peptidase [Lysobacter arenosi]
MLSLFRRLWRAPDTVPDALWLEVRARVPWLSRLDPDREARLRELTARFLHEKTISPIGELVLDEVQCCMLAALCCLPLIEFGAEGLRGWSQLIVYPDAFRVNRSHMDAAGVLHEWQDDLIGEAWEAGPVILSWADVAGDCEDPRAGFCVAAHEIAHKIDVLDGLLDGTPPLPRHWQREWARDFQAAYDALVARVDAGEETAIDGYAAEAPEEFFAVATEYHFSDPRLLETEMPEVAAHMRRFYGPSPFA